MAFGATEHRRLRSLRGVIDRTTMWVQVFDRRIGSQKSDSKTVDFEEFCCKEKESNETVAR